MIYPLCAEDVLHISLNASPSWTTVLEGSVFAQQSDVVVRTSKTGCRSHLWHNLGMDIQAEQLGPERSKLPAVGGSAFQDLPLLRFITHPPFFYYVLFLFLFKTEFSV